MKVWRVYFRGEVEYSTRDYYDAMARARQLRDGYAEEDVKVVCEIVN